MNNRGIETAGLSCNNAKSIAPVIGTLMNYIFALAFGVDNFIFQRMPYPLLIALPLVSFIALFYTVFNFKQFFQLLTSRKMIVLFLLGISISTLRYYFFYKDQGFMFFPIIRQGGAFIIGWNFFIAMVVLLKKYTLKNISQAIVTTSIVFLAYGCYQKFQDHQVGGFKRITSLFMEPSYYGDYLLLIVAPFIIYQLLNFSSLTKLAKAITISVIPLWILNIIFVQSGTALLKAASLTAFFVLFYPRIRKVKLILVGAVSLVVWATFYMGESYTRFILENGMKIIAEPSLFIENHTFYDRIYPIYSAIKNLFSVQGLFGLGFGGDYFEFKQLFPASTHAAQLIQKPSLSYFNSFASKIILFFGWTGFIWFIYQIKACFQVKNLLIKIGYANILLASLWGVANFSLPYFWFWLALVHTAKEEEA